MSCLYVRLPIKITEELTVKNLHPLIQDVRLPRQKSKKWCFIKFNDENKCKEVFEHLSNVKLDNKSIKVSYARRRPDVQIDKYRPVIFFIEDFPRDISIIELKKNLKNIENIKLFKSRANTLTVKVVMNQEDALKLFSSPLVVYNHQLTLRPSKQLMKVLDSKKTESSEKEQEMTEVTDLDYHGNFDSDSD